MGRRHVTNPNLVTMQDMSKILPTYNIQRWIRETILLPKVSGEIRNALYPRENIARLETLQKLGIIASGEKPSYENLRVTLWLAGFKVERIASDVKKIVAGKSHTSFGAVMDIVANRNKMKADFIKQTFGEENYQRFQNLGMDSDHETVDDFMEDLTSIMPVIDEEEDRTDSYHINPESKTFGDINFMELIPALVKAIPTSPEHLMAFIDSLDADEMIVLGKVTTITLGFVAPTSIALMTSKKGIEMVETVMFVCAGMLTSFSRLFGWDYINAVLSHATRDSYVDDVEKVVGKS